METGLLPDVFGAAGQGLHLHQMRQQARTMTRLKHYLLGTRIVGAWIAGGAPLIIEHLAQRRGAICRGCPMNKFSLKGWALGMLVRVTILMRRREWLGSKGLKTCAACGCPLAHKTRMPIEEIAKGIDMPSGELLKFWENCWIRAELIK